jgi:hypothetical protein
MPSPAPGLIDSQSVKGADTVGCDTTLPADSHPRTADGARNELGPG